MAVSISQVEETERRLGRFSAQKHAAWKWKKSRSIPRAVCLQSQPFDPYATWPRLHEVFYSSKPCWSLQITQDSDSAPWAEELEKSKFLLAVYLCARVKPRMGIATSRVASFR